MWTVTVDEKTVGRLRQYDWGSDPFLPNTGPGDPFRIRMVDGRCFFLESDERCRIQSKIGYEAKPKGCKAFPLFFATVGGKTHGRLSYYCPTVMANVGMALAGQKRWIRATVQDAQHERRDAPFTLDGRVVLDLRQLNAIEDLLLKVLDSQRSAPAIDDRIAACAGLIELLCTVRFSGKPEQLEQVLEDYHLEGRWSELAASARSQGSAAKAGPVLSLFLANDAKLTGWSRLGRFFGVRLANVGLCRLKSQLLGAKASYRQIRAVVWETRPESEALLVRYFCQKLRSRRALIGETSLRTAFNLLVAAYYVIKVLARLRAAAQGQRAVRSEDISAAVSVADLLVVEHNTIMHQGLFAELAEAVLATPSLYGCLHARLD
jgi:hypothetical protein